MISVVIPTYKRSKFIERAVMSVMNQTYKDIEVVVVDDNGLGTKEQILTADTVRGMQANGYSIQYVPHETNRGGCAARNTGIKKAKGEYVALLDDDDEWLPTFLEKLLQKTDDPCVGAVYSMHYEKVDGKIYHSPGGVKKLKRGNVYHDLVSGWCVTSTSFFLLRKSFVDAVNGFDESLQSFQDYDMWVRMSRVCKFDYVAERLVIKENGHSDDQVAFNPTRRKAGLDTLNAKMRDALRPEEYTAFSMAVDRWNSQILSSRIAQGKKKKEKLEYLALYKEYAAHEKNTMKRISVMIIILFGYKFGNQARFIMLRLMGKTRRVKHL